MWKTARVAALVLAMSGSIAFTRDGFAAAHADDRAFSSQNFVVTDATIARLKSVLKLSAAQEVHWRVLEAALRAFAQKPQQEADANAGFVQRIRARMKSYVFDVSAAREIAFAAKPLIDSLDEDQKRDGIKFLRALGVAALF